MKKPILIAMCSALSLSVFSTGFTLSNASGKAEAYDHAVIITDNTKTVDYTKDKLASNGLELIAQMDDMAESEAYRSWMTASDEIDEIIDAIGQGDYTTPTAVYKAAITESLFDGEIELESSIADIVENKIVASIPTQLSALNGSTELAATACVTSKNAIADDSIEDSMVYVYIYDGDYCAVVAYTADNGVVSATASFVGSYDFADIESASDLNELFADSLGINVKFALVK